MNHHSPENPTGLQPFRTIDWEHEAAKPYIDQLEALDIDPATEKIVRQGRAHRYYPGDEHETLTSEGFAKCTGLVIHSPDLGSFDLMHITPADDELYHHIQELEFGENAQALMISGSLSVSQPHHEKLLAQKGVRVDTLQVETGQAHFGIAMYTQSGNLAVVRKTPDHKIFQYRPFLLRGV